MQAPDGDEVTTILNFYAFMCYMLACKAEQDKLQVFLRKFFFLILNLKVRGKNEIVAYITVFVY